MPSADVVIAFHTGATCFTVLSGRKDLASFPFFSHLCPLVVGWVGDLSLTFSIMAVATGDRTVGPASAWILGVSSALLSSSRKKPKSAQFVGIC